MMKLWLKKLLLSVITVLSIYLSYVTLYVTTSFGRYGIVSLVYLVLLPVTIIIIFNRKSINKYGLTFVLLFAFVIPAFIDYGLEDYYLNKNCVVINAEIIKKEIRRKNRKYFRLKYSFENYSKIVTIEVSKGIYSYYKNENNVLVKVSKEKPWIYQIIIKKK